MFTRNGSYPPPKKRALRGRRLVVVDIENIVGGAVTAVEQAVGARLSITRAISLGGHEHVVIGASHVGLLATGLGWRGARIVVRSGANGADLALLDVLTEENIEQRFDEVVLASGDGIFTDAVAHLGASGVDVTVIANSAGCSKRLQVAATRTVLLDRRAAGVGGAA